MRGYGKSAAMAAASNIGESRLFLIDYLLRLLRVLALLSIWRILFAGRGVVEGMTLPTVLTYTLVAEALAEPLAARTELPWAFWDGSITMRFLRPAGIIPLYAAEAVGQWSVGFALFSLPLLLCAPLIGVNPLPHSPLLALSFVLSLGLALSVGLALETIVVSLAVGWGLQVFAMDRVRSAINLLFSGAFLPLALLPWGLGVIFGWLPFASMASAPMRLYTGTGDPGRLLGIQAAWSLLLWPIALRCWRVNQERMISIGG
jgi:ABC-2 type transport system permease protein